MSEPISEPFNTPTTREQWDDISRRLQEPFDPREVDFRVQGKVNEQNQRGQVVAYIDARAVQDRLDAVVGAGNWSFDWTPLVIDRGEVMVAKGSLTVYGVTKADAGSASNFEQTLGAVSHCFKRAAVHWGVGRYLYSLPASWVQVERGGRIPDAVLSDLRGRLPRPGGAAAKAAASGAASGGASMEEAQAPSQPRPQAQPGRSMEEAQRAGQTSGRPSSSSDRSSDRRPTRPNTVATPGAPAATEDGYRAMEAQDRGPATAMRVTMAGGEPVTTTGPAASPQQVATIAKLCHTLGRPVPAAMTQAETVTQADAGKFIVQLSADYQKQRKEAASA